MPSPPCRREATAIVGDDFGAGDAVVPRSVRGGVPVPAGPPAALSSELRERIGEASVTLYKPAIRLAHSILHDLHEAEDAVQDAFLLVLRNAPRLRELDALHGWILRIVRNAAISRLRRRSRCRPGDRVHDEDLDLDPDLPSVVYRSGSSESDPADLAAVRDAYESLPGKTRDAVRLRYVGGLDCAAVGRAMQVGEGCARMRIHRGRTALNESLAR